MMMRRQFGATTATPVPVGARVRARLALLIALLVPLLLGICGGLLPVLVVGLILSIAGYLVMAAVAVWFVVVALKQSTSLGGSWVGFRFVDTRTGQPNGTSVLLKYLVQAAFEVATLGVGPISYFFTYEDGGQWLDRVFHLKAVMMTDSESTSQKADASATPVPRPNVATPFSSPQSRAFDPMPQRGASPSPASPQRPAPAPPAPGFSAPQPSGFATVAPAAPSPVPAPPQPRSGQPSSPAPFQGISVPQPASRPSPASLFEPSPAAASPEPSAPPPSASPVPQPSPFSPLASPQASVFPSPSSPDSAGQRASHAWATSPNAPVFPPVTHIPARATEYEPAETVAIKPTHAARAMTEDPCQLEDATVADIAGASSLAAMSQEVILDDGQRLKVDEPLVLGRNPLVPDAYPNARSVQIMDETMRLSKTHLVLYPEDRRIYVVDIGATNGVYVEIHHERSRLVPREPRELRKEDLIHFGGRTLRLAP
ncbi:MAG: FHA domain-containing protein [Propionibacteriaceae bacterium]|nr:FHA domain-containing protein [Propionibacteriaceae bacterium]